MNQLNFLLQGSTNNLRPGSLLTQAISCQPIRVTGQVMLAPLFVSR